MAARPGDIVVFLSSIGADGKHGKAYTCVSEPVDGEVWLTPLDIRFLPKFKASCWVLQTIKSGSGKLP